ncbi:hypothetical protein [Aquibacillus saliphilus]|uniref:hypothetical protein n=1 Tax=Aquibacillus saliphilus TaxID=1909422 RepID=UPI001CF0CC9F|nr:hypothetical protein [Aquibacillus saliphilus]
MKLVISSSGTPFRKSGLYEFCRYVWRGITEHGHLAPSTHLEGLKSYPFDGVLTPLNFCIDIRRRQWGTSYSAAFLR